MRICDETYSRYRGRDLAIEIDVFLQDLEPNGDNGPEA